MVVKNCILETYEEALDMVEYWEDWHFRDVGDDIRAVMLELAVSQKFYLWEADDFYYLWEFEVADADPEWLGYMDKLYDEAIELLEQG